MAQTKLRKEQIETLTEADISDLGSYIENVVEDTTPQLGGNLDAQGNDIDSVGDIDYDTATGTVSALGNLGSTEAIDWATASHFTGTLDQNCTITHSNEVSGRKITLALTGEFTPTFSDVDLWAGGEAPGAIGAGETLLVTMAYLGTTCYASAELFS